MHQALAQKLSKEADRCVKCGLCLPECPTYRIAQDESESPRGRIALIDAVVRGQLPADPQLVSHLDNCLLCRRCERVCPSQVHYGFLIDQARNLLATHKPKPWARWLYDPVKLRLASRVAQWVPIELSRPFGALNRMHRAGRALTGAGPAPQPGEYARPQQPAKGRVGLFTGCATEALQGGALRAAVSLLNHAGFTAFISASAGCCGALSQHSGDPDAAAALAVANRAAFSGPLDALVSIASGCGIHLDSYEPPLPVRHFDICRFLLDFGHLQRADFRPLPHPVLLHVPCSMENVYRGGDWARRLLELIPDITLIHAGEPGQCCGAAGDYMLRHPKTAQTLRQPVLDQAATAGATTLLTSNVGCAMHLADGLRAQGVQIEVLHPVELLARQLRSA